MRITTPEALAKITGSIEMTRVDVNITNAASSKPKTISQFLIVRSRLVCRLSSASRVGSRPDAPKYFSVALY